MSEIENGLRSSPYWRVFHKNSKFRASRYVKKANFDTQDQPTLVSRKL